MDLSIPFGAIFIKIIKNNFFKPIDNAIQRMLLFIIMNDIQARIAKLQENGWTLAAIADKLEAGHNTVEKWKAGDRYPRLEKPIIDALNQLAKVKRIPPQKRYKKGNRVNIVVLD